MLKCRATGEKNNKSVSFFPRTHPPANPSREFAIDDSSSSDDNFELKRTREQRSPQKDLSQIRSRLKRSPFEEESHIDRITAHTQSRSSLSPPRSVLKQFKGWFGL